MANLFERIAQEANTNVEDIKEVPPVPTGTYLAQIAGNYEQTTSTQKQTQGLQFNIRLISAMEDVDQSKLAEFLDATQQRLNDVSVRHTIWDSGYAVSSLGNFLNNTLGIRGPLREALAQVPGKQLMVTITHRAMTSDNGTARLLAQVGSTARAL